MQTTANLTKKKKKRKAGIRQILFALSKHFSHLTTGQQPGIVEIYLNQIHRNRKTNGGFQELREGDREPFHWDRVSVWEGENVPGTDGGDGCKKQCEQTRRRSSALEMLLGRRGVWISSYCY